MKRLLLLALLIVTTAFALPLLAPVHAVDPDSAPAQPGFVEYLSGSIAIQITGAKNNPGDEGPFAEIKNDSPMSLAPYLAGRLNKQGKKEGMLPLTGKVIASLYNTQPSSREYLADILDNVGIPSVSRAYAQGTGYKAMAPFLPFWKTVRNLAYSLYIIMFVVVGVMIMLRTKVSAQAVITIQSALPNLLITLILITFSYAIVGLMIDLMYFLIYFLVYLMNSANIIDSPLKAIDRLMSYSAYSVVFEGRNSMISAVALAIGDIFSGLGTGALEVFGTILSWVSFPYLIVAFYLLINMLKLMLALAQAYIMLIVQTITAPVQILMNAMPGSKAFSGWLKKTASYLIPFPVAAAMFIFAAVLIGNPTNSTIFQDIFNKDDANPFGINENHEFYQTYGGLYTDGTGRMWMPPFTLTGNIDLNTQDVLTVIGFLVFCMTPSVVKMAQEWLQVKESPYASEALKGFVGIAQTVAGYPMGQIKQGQQMHEQKKLQDYAAGRYAEKMSEYRQASAGKVSDKVT